MMSNAWIHDNSPPLASRLELDYDALADAVAEAVTLVPDGVHPIMSDGDAGAYAETAKVLKGVAARVEAARKSEKASILEAGRTVDSFFASLSAALTPLISGLVAAISTWQHQKLAEERRAQAAEAERLRKEAELFEEDAPPAPAPVVAKDAGRVVAASGTMASASVRWVGVVVDPDKLPRPFLMPNLAAIDAAIKGGVRDIPGVEIREVVRTSIRGG